MHAWTESRLLTVLFNLLRQTQVDVAICMFIDGLDEFDGRYDSVINMITNVSDQEHVKICVSSRPLFAFKGAFAGSPCLKLQDLTFDTIRDYINKQLSHLVQQNASSNKNARQKAERLIDIIVQRADGVFLWAVIATREVRDGLQGMADLDQLAQAIEVLPPELEDLFLLVLKRIKLAFRRDAAKFLQIVLFAGHMRGFDLCRLYLISSQKELQDGPFVYENVAMSELSEACRTFETRLISHTAGLLELTLATQKGEDYCKREDWDPISFTNVNFIHKSVRDFLRKNNEAKAFLSDHGLSQTQVHLCIARGTFAHLIQHSQGDAIAIPNHVMYHPMLWHFHSVLEHVSQAERLSGSAQPKFIQSLDYAAIARGYTISGGSFHWYKAFVKNIAGTSIDIVGMAASEGMTIYVCEQLGLSLSSAGYYPSLPDLESYSTNRAALTHLSWKMLDELPHAASHGETLSRSHPYRHALGKCLRWEDGQSDNHSLAESYILCCCSMIDIDLIRILLNAGANPMVVVQPIDLEPIRRGVSRPYWFSWLCFLMRMRYQYMEAHGRSGGMLFWEGHDGSFTLRDVFEITKALLAHGADINFQIEESPSNGPTCVFKRRDLAYESLNLGMSATAMFILEECFNHEPEFQDFALAVSPLIERPIRKIVVIWSQEAKQNGRLLVDRAGCHVSADDSEMLWPIIEKWERTGHHEDLTALETAIEQIYNANGPVSKSEDESEEEGGEEAEAEATE